MFIALLVRRWFGAVLLLTGCCAYAQTVSPVIVEYKVKAEGKIALTNNTLVPMAVVVEPRSFNITPDGNGVYRPLDPEIHVQLSSMSFRIDPGQTYYVFYKAKSDKLPAWFTLYATFSSLKHTSGLDVRILLPHTVYIYPKKPQTRGEVIKVKHATYFTQSRKVVCDFENNSLDLDRIQEVQITSGGKSVTAAGFPVLPGAQRHLEVEWKESVPPDAIMLRSERSTMKLALGKADQ